MGELMKEAPVGNICYLVFHAHLCPVGPRLLDSCSLTIRTIHIREALWTPLSQSIIHFYFLGTQTSLGFYLLSRTYAMLYCFIYDCAWSTCTVYDRDTVSLYRQAQSHFRVPSRLQPLMQTLGPFRSRPTSLRVA